MNAYDPGKAIAHRERIIGLVDIGDWQAHHEGTLKDYVFDPFDLGSQRKDAGRSCSGHETLGGVGRSKSAGWLSNHVGGSHKAEMSLVYRVRSKCFGVSQTDELCATVVQTIETRYGRTALAARKWI